MGEYRYVLSTNPAVEFTQFDGNVGGTSQKKPSRFISRLALLQFRSTFWTYSSSRLACIRIFATCICCVNNGRTWCGWSLAEFVRHLIKIWQQKTHDEPKDIRSHTEQFRIINWSLKDPGAEFSPLPPQSDKETPADVLWPELNKTKDLRSTDLKQENMSQKLGVNEE